MEPGEREKSPEISQMYMAKFVCKKTPNVIAFSFLPAAKLRHFLGMVYRTAGKASFLPSPFPPLAASFRIYGKVFFIVQAQKEGGTERRGGEGGYEALAKEEREGKGRIKVEGEEEEASCCLHTWLLGCVSVV